MIERVFALHTSTHKPTESSSAALTRAGIDMLGRDFPRMEVRWVDANDLHIVENLSCYANGKKDCANPESGPYRCWANYSAKKDPDKYGGFDEMPVIYDNLAWCDTFIFSTSTRWGSQSALAQKVIERMNTLENRAVSYGEPYPLLGKRLGIVVTGLHWHTGKVSEHLLETLRWFGFATQPDKSNILAWQRSRDPYFEHPDNDKPYVERWENTERGQEAVREWARAVATSNTLFVRDPRVA
jgi:multimeric flavodoxin WrbA